MKLSTVNLLTEGIFNDISIPLEKRKRLANLAVIILQAAWICENSGIDDAMRYLNKDHGDNEYQEFRTAVTALSGAKKKVRYKSNSEKLTKAFNDVGITIDGYLMYSKDNGKNYETVFDSTDRETNSVAKLLGFREEIYE